MGTGTEPGSYLSFMAVTDRSTANTVRFEEVVPPGDQEAVGYLYVKKKALSRIGNPKLIQVTITAGKGSGG